MRKPDPYTWPEKSPGQKRQDFWIAAVILVPLTINVGAVVLGLLFIAFGG